MLRMHRAIGCVHVLDRLETVDVKRSLLGSSSNKSVAEPCASAGMTACSPAVGTLGPRATG